jgi:hypothetical protein
MFLETMHLHMPTATFIAVWKIAMRRGSRKIVVDAGKDFILWVGKLRPPVVFLPSKFMVLFICVLSSVLCPVLGLWFSYFAFLFGGGGCYFFFTLFSVFRQTESI